MKKIRKFILPVISIMLVASLIFNFYLWRNPMKEASVSNGLVVFSNANSRDTYSTVHNLKAAQAISTGEGVKVGIMDWSFGYSTHKDLYADAVNFSENKGALDEELHGFWMANTLKEIAPDCDIYALCTTDMDEDKQVDNMVKAIDWAIQNNIDVLTYSNASFSEKNRPKIDEAVNKAVDHGIVTTFIHYDNPNNFYPNGFFDSSEGKREADVNILHYDYNILIQNKYEKYKSFNGDFSKIKTGDDVPYLSMSSTSPVLAGFVAILKSINPNLSPQDYKDALIKTSYQTEYYDWGFGLKSNISHVADVGKAVAYIKENY
ncbi:subtilase family protein [Anaerobacterium chartisolvens]|uniref:Subtilase family protein n=1 Tax=Anaerobacterium chartisolvens TaxID=1297424 RepID=A0A369BE02_9FIRM|nr:S8 family serine peptidase [Anaerobacterium chartisolvens]RCX19455.1 subtilase family protein [Anaerobacterium chartisolvens]